MEKCGSRVLHVSLSFSPYDLLFLSHFLTLLSAVAHLPMRVAQKVRSYRPAIIERSEHKKEINIKNTSKFQISSTRYYNIYF